MGSKVPSKQTVVSSPPEFAKPFIYDTFQQAQEAYGKVPKNPFQGINGQLLAQPTAQERQAATLLGQLGKSNLGLGDAVTQLGQATARGDFLNVGNNPYFQNLLGSLTHNYQANVLPTVQSQAQQLGAYGGGRNQLALGQAAGDFQRAANELGSNVYFGERQLQQNAPALIQAGLGLNVAPIELLGQAGAQQRQFLQDAIQNQALKLQEQRAAPFLGLPEYASIIQGQSLPVSSTATSLGGSNPTLGALQGVLGGLQGGAGLSQSLGLSGLPKWLTVGGGALGGGLLGGFGA